MKGMTNNQIIMNEAAKLDPATLHAIATAHHTPEQIAAMAANAVTTDENGDEQPATIADVEIILAAAELHTFDYWKKEGKSVKKGETHLIECYLWKYTTRPSKAQREAAEAEGKEAAPAPHFYPTKSHLFSCLQVHDAKQAPAGRFGSVAAIMEYNKKLAAERKAAKAAAEQAASTPAPIITEEHHELPELVHVDPLPTKKASKPAATKKPAQMFQKFSACKEEVKRTSILQEVEAKGKVWGTFRMFRNGSRPIMINSEYDAFVDHHEFVYHSSNSPFAPILATDTVDPKKAAVSVLIAPMKANDEIQQVCNRLFA